ICRRHWMRPRREEPPPSIPSFPPFPSPLMRCPPSRRLLSRGRIFQCAARRSRPLLPLMLLLLSLLLLRRSSWATNSQASSSFSERIDSSNTRNNSTVGCRPLPEEALARNERCAGLIVSRVRAE
ncbi:hypothetical protein PMAYCL1PPCAC_03345, partial [Pristionchus mayeri]